MSGGHGIDVGAVEKGISDFLKPTAGVSHSRCCTHRSGSPIRVAVRQRQLSSFCDPAFFSVIEERRKSPDDRHDLVNMLLAACDPESGRTMSDAEIVDNLMTFITAGHETTALGLAWTFDLLARHPGVESRVLKEIDAVTEGRPVTSDDVSKLVYTRQVFSEAMRLYPPAPIITRTVLKDFQLGEYLIPEGTVLIVPIYAVHHHAALWSDPELFDPDRFSPENSERGTVMPICRLAPDRVCASAMLLRSWKPSPSWLCCSRRFALPPLEPQPPKPVMKVTLRPSKTLTMRLVARQGDNRSTA